MIKLVGEGIRKRVELWGQNFYLTVTKTSVDITVPFENRPEQVELRMTIDNLCTEISNLMQLLETEQCESENNVSISGVNIAET